MNGTTFGDVIRAFEDADIDVRRLYWAGDEKIGWQFYVKVDGEERLRRVIKVERIVTEPGSETTGDEWHTPDKGDIVVTIEP